MKSLIRSIQLTVLFACVSAALAQNYPTQPLRIIVPASQGSTLDALARILGGELQRTWGKRVTVENRQGENGNAGTRLAAMAPADGHTLLLAGTGFSANPYLGANAGYDPLRNFVPVSYVANLPIVLMVHPVFPAQNVKALVDVLKLSPGAFSFGSAGSGTSLHLAGEAFQHATQINLLHVPFKNSKQAEAAIVRGDIQVLFSPLPAALPLIQAGRVRPLAVSTLERHPALLDVATMGQAGVDQYDFVSWFGLMAPINTPPAVVQKLSQHVGKIMRQPTLKQRLSAQFVEVVGGTPAQLGALIQKDQQRWVAVAEAAKRAAAKLEEPLQTEADTTLPNAGLKEAPAPAASRKSTRPVLPPDASIPEGIPPPSATDPLPMPGEEPREVLQGGRPPSATDPLPMPGEPESTRPRSATDPLPMPGEDPAAQPRSATDPLAMPGETQAASKATASKKSVKPAPPKQPREAATKN